MSTETMVTELTFVSFSYVFADKPRQSIMPLGDFRNVSYE